MTVKKDYHKINDKFNERLDFMTKKHSKVTFFRYDVRFPEHYPHDGTNNDFSQLLKLTKEQQTRSGIEMHYVWCREQNTSENPHYHVAALVNGNLTQRVGGILSTASHIWGNITSSPEAGLIEHCGHFDGQSVPYQIRVDRPSSKKDGEELEEQRQAFIAKVEQVKTRAQYLGKGEQKGKVPKGVREYGASELPKAGK